MLSTDVILKDRFLKAITITLRSQRPLSVDLSVISDARDETDTMSAFKDLLIFNMNRFNLVAKY